MIPRRLIRTVPAVATPEVEGFWRKAMDMHLHWETITFRDPITPAAFPLTSPYWSRCATGAQLAGLIRLEALWHGGGVYLDSDVEVFRPLDPLLQCQAFAAWEDERVVPDAILGAEPEHPAIRECIHQAIKALSGGTWESGPGVTTAVLPGRDDVLLLPPGSLYPIHYKQKHLLRRAERHVAPWSFTVHHWHHSWREAAA